jgi:hypothetical protein
LPFQPSAAALLFEAGRVRHDNNSNEIVNNIGANPDDGSNTATYIRSDKVGDTRYMAILRAGYPHQQFTSLGLESKEEGYYATKLALWMYIRGNDPEIVVVAVATAFECPPSAARLEQKVFNFAVPT